MIKGLLLKEATKGAQIVNTNGLDDYYRILKCSYIDIQEYEVGGKYYSFIYDDEFLYNSLFLLLLLKRKIVYYNNLLSTKLL